jgi:hypothetical protein
LGEDACKPVAEMLVDFVIGGTQKGGTSALDAFLRQHPQICMPIARKELHFFDREAEPGQRLDYSRYHENFQPQPQQRVVGEATPSYMYWNTAPYQIWRYNPKMKWILVLRNPIDRAYSQWNMEIQRGKETLPFAEAIELEPQRAREALPLQHRVYSYLDRGFYSWQVRRLFNIFTREQCTVLLNEDLRRDHEGSLGQVFDFLEVDRSVIPPPAAIFEHDYDSALAPDLQERLREIFYFDIKALEQLLRRDLSLWYRNP